MGVGDDWHPCLEKKLHPGDEQDPRIQRAREIVQLGDKITIAKGILRDKTEQRLKLEAEYAQAEAAEERARRELAEYERLFDERVK
jgi:hypothetical protein